jgi:class 3 adenylate cyclase
MPETQFTRNSGMSLAYQVAGDGPIDVVLVPGYVSHVEMNWDYPFYGCFLKDLARYARVVVLDKRGNGLSDRSLGLGTFEERMDDVRAVMDAAGLERAALVGVSEGAAMCVVMAATHPDRVSSLALYGPACPGLFPPEIVESALELVEENWNTGEVVGYFVQHAPDPEVATPRMARLERYSCTPSVAREIMWQNLTSDIRSVVPTVSVPTLVMHTRDDPAVPFAHGQFFAEQIPGATLVPLEGDFHSSWLESDYEPILAETRTFLTGEAAVRPVRVDRILSTVLFTDIADSTAMASELGDARWRALLDRHDRAAAEEVAAHGGVLVKSTGDGILARFDGPSRAVACAHALRRRADGLGLRTRAGAHTGEIELRGDDVGGIAVHIASRVASEADAGEVLVSRTVKDLTVGADVVFEDRGEHALKGVPETWRLYATAV